MAFGHFCEQHGPSIISTLQALPPDPDNAPPVFSPVMQHTVPPLPGQSSSYPPGPASTSTSASTSCAACSMHLPQSISSQLSRPQAPTLRTVDPTTGYAYVTTRHPKSQTRYSVLRTAVVKALSSELIPSRTGPVLFGDAHNGYTIAYVFAIDDPEARGGKREGRRWYAFLALFECESEATAAWPWVTSCFERLARGLRDCATKRASLPVSNAAGEGSAVREDIEQVFIVTLDERSPSHQRTRGSFGHPEGGYVRRPRFGNPGGIGTYSSATTKGLGELIGVESVDVEIHAGLSWIMSGLLGPRRDVAEERSTSNEEQNRTESLPVGVGEHGR